MLKDLLQTQEPIVYQALFNACASDRISHAYLFTGPAGTPKKEAAYLLAQSLFCQNTEDLACETCETCLRIKDNNHMDFMVLDGSDKAIGKKEIDALQEKFSKTSSESGTGQRCYIILNAENSSVAAQNSMLKFLEEPGKDITAILTVDNQNRLLPTIISRCTMIPFHKLTTEMFYEEALQEGMSPQDAYYASHVINRTENIKEEFESARYQNAFMMFEQFLKGVHQELLVDYDISYRCKEKEDNIQMVRYFLDLLDLYGHDVILQSKKGYSWYQELIQKHEKDKDAFGKLIIICNEEKDTCNKFNDISLVMAKAYDRLEEFNSVLR